jgi:YHS domain-containing protein
MKQFIAAVAVTALVSGAAFAQHGDAKAKQAPATAKAAKKEFCTVMGHEFAPTAKTAKSTYKGKTYYFCCAGCKPTFDKDPAKYAAVKNPKTATPAKPAKPATPAKPTKKAS